MNMNIASNQRAALTFVSEPQLELSFGGGCPPEARRPARQRRANWWFQRMRQIVDRAREWQPAPPPEQIWFPNARREFSLPESNSDQRLICE